MVLVKPFRKAADHLVCSALDIWSAGTILLSFLSCKFPVFNANDDIEALMEIAAILGRKRVEKCAQLHSQTFQYSSFIDFLLILE